LATRALTILKRVGLGVLVLVGVLLVLGLTIGIPVPGWLVRDNIETALSQVLNHDFSLDGKLRIRVGLNIRAQITDVHIAEAGTNLVTAETITASLSLRHLLDREIVVSHVAASGIHILNFDAFTDVDTGGDDDDDDTSTEDDGIKLAFDTFTIRDSSLNWGLAGADWRLDIGELTGTAPLGEHIQGTLTGALRDLPVQLDLDAEELTPLIHQRLPWPFTAQGTVAKTVLDANGELQVFSPFKMQTAFKLDTPGIGLFNHLFELPLPDPGKIAVAGVFGFDDGEGVLSFSDVDGTAGYSDFRGQVDVDIRADPPKLTGELEGNRFVADDWLGGDGTDDDGDDAGFDLEEIIAQATDITKDLGVEADLGFATLDALGIRLDAVDTRLDMTPGRLAAETLSFALGTSHGSGTVAMVENPEDHSIEGQITFDTLALKDLPLIDPKKLPEAVFRDTAIGFTLGGRDLRDFYRTSRWEITTGTGSLHLADALTAHIGTVAVTKKPGPESDFQVSGTWEQRPAHIAGKFRWTDQELRVVVEPELLGNKVRIDYVLPVATDRVPELSIDTQLMDVNLILEALAASKKTDPPDAHSTTDEEADTAYTAVTLPDLELQGQIDELRVQDITIKPLIWIGGIRDNVLELDVSTTVSGYQFLGNVEVESGDTGFRVDLGFEAKGIGLPELFGTDDVPDAEIGKALIELSSSGRDFPELLANAEFGTELFRVDLPLPESIPAEHLYLDTGILQMGESAVFLSMRGTVDGLPIDARLVSAPLSTVLEKKTLFPLAFHGTIGGHTYHLEGFPDEAGVIQLDLSASGPSLDAPAAPGTIPWLTSPYEMEGHVEWSEEYLLVEDLELRVGSSRIDINATYDTAPERAKLVLSIVIPRWDLEDFALPVSPAVSVEVLDKSTDEEGTITVQTAGSRAPIMTALHGLHEKMPDFDLQVFLIAGLHDGPHDLGNIMLVLNSTPEGFLVDPLAFYLPEGKLELTANLDLTAPFFMAALAANANSFDYGMIMPLVSADVSAQGMLDLDARVWMSGDTILDMRNNLNGYVDVAVWPTGLSSEIIDKWTGSIFQVLMPVVEGVTGTVDKATGTGAGEGTQGALDNIAGRQRGSVLNCIVMHPRFEHGVMTDDTLLLDTTGSIVHGRGEVSFPENTIDFRLIPQAKVEKFFSIATPIDIKGSLDNFSIGLTAGGLVGTIVKFYYNIYYVVYRRIAGGGLPADGFETCYKASKLYSKEAEEEEKD